MKPKIIFFIVATIIILLGLVGGFLLANTSPPLKQEAASGNNDIKTYSPEDVSRHDSRSDCWTIINDKVYDITAYITRHPGGTEIERACGIDATSLFTKRETQSGETVGSGSPHSSFAQQQLERLKIGKVAN